MFLNLVAKSQKSKGKTQNSKKKRSKLIGALYQNYLQTSVSQNRMLLE
jgi:hypothetical protein